MNPRRLATLAAVVVAGLSVDIFLFYLLYVRDLPFDQFLYLQNIEREIRNRPVFFIGNPPKEVLSRYAVRDLGRDLYQITPR